MPVKMKLAAIDICFERLSQIQPDPQTELDFTDPFTLLVAVVLSAQATDVGVNKATRRPVCRRQYTSGNGGTWQ
jgi:endonuclease-3